MAEKTVKKDENTILVEDPTGEIKLHFDKNANQELKNILLDDIIGIPCKKTKDIYYVKRIFYPDVPSSREITKTKDKIQIAVVFMPPESTTSAFKKTINHLCSIKKLSVIFLFSYSKKFSSDIVHSKLKLIQIPPKSAPKLFQLDKIRILAVPNTFCGRFFGPSSPREMFLSILKRRELITPPPLAPHIHEKFFLDGVPDIIISDFNGTFYQNYKGTTMVSNSDPQKVFFINLKTRDVQKISV